MKFVLKLRWCDQFYLVWHVQRTLSIQGGKCGTQITPLVDDNRVEPFLVIITHTKTSFRHRHRPGRLGISQPCVWIFYQISQREIKISNSANK